MDLLCDVREHLAAADVVRRPGEPGAAAVCWVESEARSADEPVWVLLQDAGHATPTQRGVDELVVEIVVAARNAHEGEFLQRVIAGRLDGAREVQVGAVAVAWCSLWRGLRPVDGDDGRTTQSFRFACRRR